MEQTGKDKVTVRGGRGSPRTGFYKASVGYLEGYFGEGQISYGGPGAVERGKLAIEILKERLNITKINCTETRFDLIGLNSLYGEHLSKNSPYEVRVRFAGRTKTEHDAIKIGNEVETLYTNGPAGGGGVMKMVHEVLAVVSVLIPEEKVRTRVLIEIT